MNTTQAPYADGMNQPSERDGYSPSYTPSTSSPVTDTQIPQTLPGYRLIKEIGHGAQGKVYAGERESDHAKVAIKKFNIGSVKSWKEFELFQREAQTLASIKFPGIAKFYEAVDRLEDDPPCSYIIQEFIEGYSLNTMLKNGHRFSMDLIYEIILQMLEILDALQSHNPPIIHRDIKPSNVILEPIGEMGYRVRLIDFGAVANPQFVGGGSTVAGTFGYMAPEQLMGKPVPASDVYSLAALAVHLITGKSPADMHVKDFHLIFEPEMQQMPPELVATLRSMLDPNVETRASNISELRQIFESYKNNRFITLSDKVAHMTDEEYIEKLENFNKIGEDGNIELWQKLPDSTPRNVPSIYRNLNSYFLNNDRITKKSFALKILKYIAITGACIGVCFLLSPYSLLFESLLYIFLFILCMLVFIVISPLTWFFGIIFISSKNNAKAAELQRRQLHEEANKKAERKYLKLIETGRKSIATITKIEYVSAKPVLVDLSRSSSKGFYYRGLPTFKITYKFNPPDDEKEDDLIREYIIHDEPMTDLRIGDPLPILYKIYRDNNVEKVISMPFPFPLTSHAGYREIINETSGAALKKKNGYGKLS